MHSRRLMGLLVAVFVLTLGWVAATPSTVLPVGLTEATGDSMHGEDVSQLIVYIDVEPTINDVVVYYSEPRDEWIRHRVVDETDNGYITQGDALSMTDYEYRGDIATEQNTAGIVVLTVDNPFAP